MPGQLGGNRYKMVEKLLNIIKDNYFIEDDQGRRIFEVDAKLLRLRDTFDLKDMQGTVLYTIQDRPVRIRDTMAIMRGGQTVASVKKALIAPLRERFSVDLAGSNSGWDVQGNIMNREYEIKQGGQPVAQVSKRWLSLRDQYTVDVALGQDDALILAVCLCIDQMRE